MISGAITGISRALSVKMQIEIPGAKQAAEKVRKAAPRGLKFARRVKTKGLIGTTEVVP